jgi:hypothetical protein
MIPSIACGFNFADESCILLPAMHSLRISSSILTGALTGGHPVSRSTWLAVSTGEKETCVQTAARLAVGSALAGLERCDLRAQHSQFYSMLVVSIIQGITRTDSCKRKAYTEDVVIFTLKPRQAIIQGSFQMGKVSDLSIVVWS